MPSAKEIINQQRALEAANAFNRELGGRLDVTSVQAELIERHNQQQRNLREARITAADIMRESGIYKEIKEIKDDYRFSVFPRQNLLVNYSETGARITLAWGDGYVVRDIGGSSEFNFELGNGCLSIITPYGGGRKEKYYYKLDVDVNIDGSLVVAQTKFEKVDWQNNRQSLSNALAYEFLTASRNEPDRGPYETSPIGGGGMGGMGGAG